MNDYDAYVALTDRSKELQRWAKALARPKGYKPMPRFFKFWFITIWY